MEWRIYLLFILLFVAEGTLAQTERRNYQATRAVSRIEIDGKLDESDWQVAERTSDFTCYEPENGKPSPFRSEVAVLFDDQAIYVAAWLFDPSPDSIMRQLSVRDDFGNSDGFGIELNTYDDGQNAFVFRINAANVQVDYKSTPNLTDYLWNAVWESQIQFTAEGWQVEFRIPYSALRFANVAEQVWGVNFYRNIRRFREGSFWNPVPKGKGAICSHAGRLTGIRDVKPPLRMSLNPYTSSYYKIDDQNKQKGFSFNGGLDLKLGLSESFTLDMTLVPDFGQTRTDAKVLNLSPFEVYFNENREFFNEGTELFTKAGLFYSRRIGNVPSGYFSAWDKTSESEELVENPTITPMINATKITGRTSSNLGIGIFNSITNHAFAVAKDSLTGEKRNIQTEPFANYNLFVLDQSFGKNSYINVINTNVLKPENGFVANVSGMAFSIMEKTNLYGISGNGAFSHRRDSSSMTWEDGSFVQMSIGKFNGVFTASSTFQAMTRDYNPNDLGFLSRANQLVHSHQLGYRKFEPFWKLIDFQVYLSWWQDYLFEPRKYSDQGFQLEVHGTTSNYLSCGINLNWSPGFGYDFYEPRVEGRFYRYSPNQSINFWLSTDYRKRFAFDGGFSFYTNQAGSKSGSVSFSPRIRLSDRCLLVFETNYHSSLAEFGFLDILDTGIIFSKRAVREFTNSISTSFIFNNKAYVSLFVRHYWSGVDYQKYKRYYLLNEDGNLSPFQLEPNPDNLNFNFFSLDLSFNWNFAPGSFMSLVWKNEIFPDNDGDIYSSLFRQFENTLNSAQINSFSLKITYYIDYLMLKKSFLSLSSIASRKPVSQFQKTSRQAMGTRNHIPVRLGHIY